MFTPANHIMISLSMCGHTHTTYIPTIKAVTNPRLVFPICGTKNNKIPAYSVAMPALKAYLSNECNSLLLYGLVETCNNRHAMSTMMATNVCTAGPMPRKNTLTITTPTLRAITTHSHQYAEFS